MLALIDIHHHYRAPDGPQVIFEGLNLRVDRHDHVGILAAGGSGKTTLARIMTGARRPVSGHVIRDMRVSWPINFASAFHPALSGAENVIHIARLQNADTGAVLARVRDLSELGDALSAPVETYAPGMRARLALSLTLSLPFDCYLADEIPVAGNATFQERFNAALAMRMEQSALVLLTRHAHLIRRYASRCFVIAGGRLISAADAEEAQAILSHATSLEIA